MKRKTLVTIIGVLSLFCASAAAAAFRWQKDSAKLKKQLSAKCPDTKECPAPKECPVCPEGKACPACPAPKKCAECKKCEKCAACPKCSPGYSLKQFVAFNAGLGLPLFLISIYAAVRLMRRR